MVARPIVIGLILSLAVGCAHSGSKPASGTTEEITEDNPGYYEPELHRKYYDERYEGDPAFEKYYEWKQKE